ncbi:UBC12 enzyme, partial [Eurystomus gularis]|nr:UBC12 enzyme [Eurystomus gularis]
VPVWLCWRFWGGGNWDPAQRWGWPRPRVVCVPACPTCHPCPHVTRVPADINELNLPKTCEIDFSDQDDLLHFRLLICPDEGFYKGGKFVFSFKVGQGYPHDPPKVKCETMVYHPNIDLEGNVCLNILRWATTILSMVATAGSGSPPAPRDPVGWD